MVNSTELDKTRRKKKKNQQYFHSSKKYDFRGYWFYADRKENPLKYIYEPKQKKKNASNRGVSIGVYNDKVYDLYSRQRARWSFVLFIRRNRTDCHRQHKRRKRGRLDSFPFSFGTFSRKIE